MQRTYDTGETHNVTFFVGTEIEHTPAHGRTTLFVVGVQKLNDIQDWLNDYNGGEDCKSPITHIYFGANMSFPKISVNNGAEWAKWETMIFHFLEMGYWCTLDVDISCVEGIVESGLTENRRFIPMISAKIPYTQLLGYNATVKIDDIGFDKTNPGVWCHRLNKLTAPEEFTGWDEYKQDTILG